MSAIAAGLENNSFGGTGAQLDLVGWTQVNPKQLALHRQLFNHDEHVRKAYRTLCNALLAGNILFQSKSSMKTSRFEKSTDADAWRSEVYGECGKDSIADYFMNGFIFVSKANEVVHDTTGKNGVVIKRGRFGPKPVVLDTEYMDIFFRTNVRKEILWRLFERIEAGFTDAGVVTPDMEWGLPSGNFVGGRYQTLVPRLERREIFDFTAYVLDRPTKNGNLTSTMVGIVKDIFTENMLLQKCYQAQALQSNPPIVSQRESAKADDSTLTLGNPVDDSSGGGGGGVSHSLYLGNGKEEGPIKGSQAMQMLAIAQDMGYTGLGAPCDEDTKSKQLNRTETRTTYVNGEPVTEVFLDTDRSYVKYTPPQADWDKYLSFKLGRMESIFMLFGIPISQVSQVNSLGQKTSSNEDSKSVYLDTQNHLRQILIKILTDVYKNVTLDSHAQDFLIDVYGNKKGAAKEFEDQRTEEELKEEDKKSDGKKFREAMDVTITMPGLPPQELTMELFDRKILKYPALLNYLKARWSYPDESFETTAPPNEMLELIREKEAKKVGSKTKSK